jgi:hypothetical protein
MLEEPLVLSEHVIFILAFTLIFTTISHGQGKEKRRMSKLI